MGMGNHGKQKSSSRTNRLFNLIRTPKSSDNAVIKKTDAGQQEAQEVQTIATPAPKAAEAPAPAKRPNHRPSEGLNHPKTLYINDVLNRILRRYAFESNCKESDVVREALTDFFNSFAEDPNIPDIPDLPPEDEVRPKLLPNGKRPPYRPSYGLRKAKTLNVTEKCNQLIRRYAYEHEINESAILRLALRDFFRRHKNDIDFGKDAF